MLKFIILAAVVGAVVAVVVWLALQSWERQVAVLEDEEDTTEYIPSHVASEQVRDLHDRIESLKEGERAY